MRLAADPTTSPPVKRLEYEYVACYQCYGTGVMADLRPCPNYGQVLKPRNRPCTTPGCGATRKDSHRYLQHGDKVCERCNGAKTLLEDAYSNVPSTVWSALDFVVMPQARAMTWVESFLGIGAAYSCVDYGAHIKLTDDELIAKVRGLPTDPPHTQALNILADRKDASDSPLVALMVIATFRDGYKVVALPPALSDDLTESLAATAGSAAPTVHGHESTQP